MVQSLRPTGGSAERVAAQAGIEVLAPLLSDDGKVDPYPHYERLQQHHPVLRVDEGRQIVVSRHADVRIVLRGPEFAKDFRRKLENQGRLHEGRLSPESELRSRLLLNLDPPDHTRVRGAVAAAFGSEALQGQRAAIRARLAPVVARGADEDALEVADLAGALAAGVIGDLLGLPVEDLPFLQQWARAGSATSDPLRSPEVAAAGDEAARRFDAYFRAVVASARTDARGDLVGDLVRAVDRGDLAEDAELVGLLTTLFIAGYETSASFLPMALNGLCTHQDALRLLMADPGLLPTATDELLRWDCPIQLTSRTVMATVVLGEEEASPGDSVVCLLGAANRDPAVFAEPARVDLARGRARGIPFGGGIHHCLGAVLARMEVEEVLRALMDAYAAMHLTEPPTWRRTLVFRGIDQLSLAVVPR